ncbi:suppressor of fused domain protein [Cytobacillus sp. IB215665]|uniref:suppressor of fused domain protein n=1 Tax=Cytobacillus sp. IB215665 TaxID=3097357 RepID=UPI002A16D16A|nr:suppressor of fused domain protein [Cytobacillus sp. IB215665]MDX8365154.1 suppressor of fused domain protein [Cytobacillus sp. IB215665]
MAIKWIVAAIIGLIIVWKVGKTILEGVREGIKEGVEEAKEELKHEEDEHEKTYESLWSTAYQKSDEERFGIALKAMFVEFYMHGPILQLDWNEDNSVYLFTEVLPEDKLEFLKKKFKDEWGINDRGTLLKQIYWLKYEGHRFQYETKTNNMHIEAAAFDFAREAMLVCDGVAFGYITGDEGKVLLKKISIKTANMFSGWKEYAESFMTGATFWMQQVSLNKKMEKRYHKTLNWLLENPLSPWVKIPWGTDSLLSSHPMDIDARDIIEDHIETYIGEIKNLYVEEVSDTVSIDIYHIEATEARPFHTFITMGMSDLPIHELPDGWKYSELMMSVPAEWEVSNEGFTNEDNYFPIRLLKYLAKNPHLNKEEEPLSLWSINQHAPAEPFTNNIKMTGSILLPPLLFDREFFEVDINIQKKVHFFNVLPLYSDEITYLLANEEKSLLMQNNEIPHVFNPTRKSLLTELEKINLKQEDQQDTQKIGFY